MIDQPVPFDTTVRLTNGTFITAVVLPSITCDAVVAIVTKLVDVSIFLMWYTLALFTAVGRVIVSPPLAAFARTTSSLVVTL